MGIDGIGKKPPAPPTGDVGGASRADAPQKTFEVKTDRANEATRATEVATTAPTPLDRLRAGEIDLNQYVELKVEQATSHLHGLGHVEMESIRDALRAKVEGDPAFVDLVTRATGRASTPRE